MTARRTFLQAAAATTLLANLPFAAFAQSAGTKYKIGVIGSGKVAWPQTFTILVTATIGGYAGARIARRMNPRHVRAGVIAIGVTVTAAFFIKTFS